MREALSGCKYSSMVVHTSLLIWACWLSGSDSFWGTEIHLSFLPAPNPAFWVSCYGRIAKAHFYLGKNNLQFSVWKEKEKKKIGWFPGQFLCFCNWFILMVLRWIPGICSWQLSNKKESLNIVASKDAGQREPLSCGDSKGCTQSSPPLTWAVILRAV